MYHHTSSPAFLLASTFSGVHSGVNPHQMSTSPISFGSGCYVAHLASAAASCTATTKSVTPPEGELKSQLLGSSPQVSITPQDALTRISFEPTRGIASWDGSGSQAGLSLASTAGSWQLTVTLSAVGRVNVCSPGGSIKGYPPC